MAAVTDEYRRARRALARLALRLADGDRDLAMGLLAVAADAIRDAQRSACVTIADQALLAAGGDKDAAKAMLRGPLEAIGALPYEHAPGKYRWGAAS